MSNNHNRFGIRGVNFDEVLEYEEIQDVLTSDRFNTENILVIPTINGIELGMKVKFKNKEGHICEDVRNIGVFQEIPMIFIGGEDLYDQHFSADECFVPVERQVCDSKETNWFHHNVDAFPIFTQKSSNHPIAEKSMFEFDHTNFGTEYFKYGKYVNYLSPKGLYTIMQYLQTSPKEVISRICDGMANGSLPPEGIIHLDLDELDSKFYSESLNNQNKEMGEEE